MSKPTHLHIRIDWEALRAKAEALAQHGKDCPKVEHIGSGYLHSADDDGPYDVDGVTYCGRCHGWLGNSPDRKAENL